MQKDQISGSLHVQPLTQIRRFWQGDPYWRGDPKWQGDTDKVIHEIRCGTAQHRRMHSCTSWTFARSTFVGNHIYLYFTKAVQMRTCSLVKVKFCIRASWEGDDFERNSAKYGTSDSRLFHLLRWSKTSTETAHEFLLQVRQNMTKKEPRNVRAPSFAISTIRRRTQQCIVSIHVQFACHSILYINARALLGSLCDLRSLESRGKKIAYNLHHQHTGYVIFILSKKKKWPQWIQTSAPLVLLQLCRQVH